MGSKRYTLKEITYLKNNYKNKTRKELAKHLNRSVPSIGYQLAVLGLTKNPNQITRAEIKPDTFVRLDNWVLKLKGKEKKLFNELPPIGSKFIAFYHDNSGSSIFYRKSKSVYIDEDNTEMGLYDDWFLEAGYLYWYLLD